VTSRRRFFLRLIYYRPTAANLRRRASLFKQLRRRRDCFSGLTRRQLLRLGLTDCQVVGMRLVCGIHYLLQAYVWRMSAPAAIVCNAFSQSSVVAECVTKTNCAAVWQTDTWLT